MIGLCFVHFSRFDRLNNFKGEIIGPKYSFLTRKWDSNEKIDREHWSRFPAFKEYEKCFNADDFAYDPKTSDFVFMRWKELFLVPVRICSFVGSQDKNYSWGLVCRFLLRRVFQEDQ